MQSTVKMLPGSVFLPRIGARLVEVGLSREAWVKLNRLRTGVGQFHLSMHKWGFAPSPNCECGAAEQIADHVLIACPIHRTPHGARGLTVLDASLTTSLPASDPGSTTACGSKRINPRPQSCLCLTWSGCPSKRRRRQIKKDSINPKMLDVGFLCP